MRPIDWNATAAWIALVISVTGTIVGPIITTILTNRHQLKLRRLDIQQSAFENYQKNRLLAINTFLARAGRCLSDFDDALISDLGESYYCIYQYVPIEFWDKLDEFYKAITTYNKNNAKNLYPPIARYLSEILREESPARP